MKRMPEALQCCLQGIDYSDIDLSLDLTIDRTYAMPSIPTTTIVIAPYAFSSAPFQEDTSIKAPSPFVETYQTKYADAVVIYPIRLAMTIFTCLGKVLPVA